jgi:hypothetical protein
MMIMAARLTVAMTVMPQLIVAVSLEVERRVVSLNAASLHLYAVEARLCYFELAPDEAWTPASTSPAGHLAQALHVWVVVAVARRRCPLLALKVSETPCRSRGRRHTEMPCTCSPPGMVCA